MIKFKINFQRIIIRILINTQLKIIICTFNKIFKIYYLFLIKEDKYIKNYPNLIKIIKTFKNFNKI